MSNLNTAIPLFVGWKISPYPKEDASRLVEEFGVERGMALAAMASSTLKELQGIEPDWGEHTLQTASEWAVGRLKAVHPELDDDASAALEWIYSWWWK